MKRVIWIDVAKFVAIVTVCVHHLYGVWSRESIVVATNFAVPLFILIMGIVCYWSCERNFGNLRKHVLKCFFRIMVPYLIATAVYYVKKNHAFVLVDYVNNVVHFNASGPFYFVCLYMQLLFVMPFLFYSLKILLFKCAGSRIQILFVYLAHGIFVLFVGWLATNYSDVFGVYSGKLFGGSFLVLFFAGMVIAENYRYLPKGGVLGLVVFSLLIFCLWRFECYNHYELDKKLRFTNERLNPPGVSLWLFAIFMAGFVYNLCAVLKKNAFLNKIMRLLAWGGGIHCMFFCTTC